ncbi:MAG: ribbon-helix-helix protein, CopG family [Coriobacteriia bacterium]|nr:ribbon-helix-helix protein, CopG family [Coriobacteriia bacterium]
MAKVNVSIPDELLEQVDAIAADLHRSRSGLVQEATAQYVARVQDERAREERRESIERAIAGARALAELIPDGEDGTTIIRRDRDTDHGRISND